MLSIEFLSTCGMRSLWRLVLELDLLENLTDLFLVLKGSTVE